MSARIAQAMSPFALCNRCQSFNLGPECVARHNVQTFSAAQVQLDDLLASCTTCVLCDLLLQCIRKYQHGTSPLRNSDVFRLERRVAFVPRNLIKPKAEPKGSEYRVDSSDNDERDGGELDSRQSDTGGHTATLRLTRAFVTSGDNIDVHILPVTSHHSSEPLHKNPAAFIRSSLQRCQEEHSCASRIDSATIQGFLNLVESTAFGVIDVIEMKLTTLPVTKEGPEKFVALSYVWGTQKRSSVGHFQTTCLNVLDRVRPGGLSNIMDQLPQTIKDAIKLVQDLDLRYLWIDALCIVQDSRDCWLINAEAMHFVYANACLTICACDGDSNSGLKSYSTPKTSTALASMILDAGHTRVYGVGDDSLYAEWTSDLSFLAVRPMQPLIDLSAWSKRAWTFQEHIFSPREATFVGGRAFFLCHLEKESHSVYSDDAKFNSLICETATDPKFMDASLKSPMQRYIAQVEAYTTRNLTMQKDILTAFRGLQWLLQRLLKTDFLFGLPVSHFDLALLWQPKGIAKPRISQHSCQQSDDTGTCSTRSRRDCDDISDDDVVLFPSWSWAGWLCSGVAYDPVLLKDCMGDMHQWLSHYTWIQWYIRDSEGVLRPLWRFASTQQEVTSEHSPRTSKTLQSASDPKFHQSRGYTIQYKEPSPTKSSHQTSPVIEEQKCNDHNAGLKGPLETPDTNGIDKERNSSDKSRAINECTHTAKAQAPAARIVKRGIYELSPNYGNLPPLGDSPRLRKLPRARNTDKRDTRWQDRYGRLVPAKVPQEREEFERRIPDHPFGVRRDDGPCDASRLNPMPILQFFTWYKRFRLSQATNPGRRYGGVKPGLERYDIVDKGHAWCGTITLEAGMMRGVLVSSAMHFIALSHAKYFTEQEFGSTDVDSKMPKVPSWGIYFVMMLTHNEKRGMWERAGLGKVQSTAFEDAEWKEIKLG